MSKLFKDERTRGFHQPKIVFIEKHLQAKPNWEKDFNNRIKLGIRKQNEKKKI